MSHSVLNYDLNSIRKPLFIVDEFAGVTVIDMDGGTK